MISIVGYLINRRGDIVRDSAKDFTKVSDAVSFVKDNTGNGITFVQGDVNEVNAVKAFLSDKGMDLYPTKRPNRYVLGSARRPVVACSIE